MIRAIAITLAILAAATSPAFADFCGERESETVFECPLANSTRIVRVCRHEGNWFQYVYGKPGQEPELVLSRPKNQVVYTPWNGISRTIWSSLGLRNGDYLYEVSFAFDKIDRTQTGALLVYKGDKIVAEKDCRPGTLRHSLMDLDQIF